MSELNYEKIFKVLVDETATYLEKYNLKAMILGISGGIDSTVVATICYEVSKKTGIPLIGRSLPIKNKEDEFSVSKLVGEAFCDDFRVCEMHGMMEHFEAGVKYFENPNLMTPIAWGNIQARLRMTYLYNLASISSGLVMSTDNQTEYQLGFWTIHGDVGDFDPIQDLWKTEVYELAEYIAGKYDFMGDVQSNLNLASQWYTKANCIRQSIALTPTDGLGISNSDLDQIGAKSYSEVDDILQSLLIHNPTESHNHLIAFDAVYEECIGKYGKEVVDKVWKRHKASAFKREKAPMYICRSRYE